VKPAHVKDFLGRMEKVFSMKRITDPNAAEPAQAHSPVEDRRALAAVR
jgi:hypothetical protein